MLPSRQDRSTDPIVVAFVDLLAPGLRAALKPRNPGQRLNKALAASQTLITSATNNQFRRHPEPRQMPRPPFVPAFAVEPIGSTAKAQPRRFQRLGVNPHRKIALHPDDAISRER